MLRLAGRLCLIIFCRIRVEMLGLQTFGLLQTLGLSEAVYVFGFLLQTFGLQTLGLSEAVYVFGFLLQTFGLQTLGLSEAVYAFGFLLQTFGLRGRDRGDC